MENKVNIRSNNEEKEVRKEKIIKASKENQKNNKNKEDLDSLLEKEKAHLENE